MREVRMTFGEHLEELRRRVIFALLWLAASTTVCFIFGEALMSVSLRPHERAVRAAVNKGHFEAIERTAAKFESLMGGSGRWEPLFVGRIKEAFADQRIRSICERLSGRLAPAFPADRQPAMEGALLEFGNELSEALMDLFAPEVQALEAQDYLAHFEKLQERLEKVASENEPTAFQEILGLGIDFEQLLAPLKQFVQFLRQREEAILEKPPDLEELKRLVEDDTNLKEVAETYRDLEKRVDDLLQPTPIRPKLLKYMEAFMTYFKVSLIFGILFSLPLILYEMWKFVGAGLYEHEQRYVVIFLPFSIALFVGGVFFGHSIMVPFALEFLAGWGTGYADISFTLENYINLFFTLTIILGLVFQTPLVMLFLYQIDMVSAAGFARVRKYTLLCAVIFSTLVTPPDPLSWSLMAGPIVLLYELGIRICQVLERRKRRGAGREKVAAGS